MKNKQITYEGIEVPQNILEEILSENSAYEVAINNNTKSKHTVMELLPLTIPSEEGIVFRLAEPLNEPNVVCTERGEE